MKVIVTNSYDESCAVMAGMIRDLVNREAQRQAGPRNRWNACPHLSRSWPEMNQAGEVDFSQVQL